MENSKQMQNLLGLALSENFRDSRSAELKKTVNHKDENMCLGEGQMLNQYSIIKELGRGGMGIVYHALDTVLNREIALKIIISGDSKNASKLIHEAKSIAQLNHPNIVQIFEVGEFPIPFFTMELVDGISLNAFIQQHSKKLKNKDYFYKIAKMFIFVAEALHFAHHKKIIHRDIKPENIMLDYQLQPKIMDFGIAKGESEQQITTNELAGTPMYMSPEQAKSLKVTRSTDIYCLGATLYESLTTRTLFQGDTVFNIMYQIIHNDPVRLVLLNPDIPKELEAICLKCLEKKPAKRYSSMKLLAKDLTNFLENKPVSAKPIGTIEIIKKFIVRNKLLSSTVAIIFVASVFCMWTIVTKGIAVAEKEKAVAEKEKAVAEKEKAVAEKNIAHSKRAFVSLKNNLHFANMHIINKDPKAANQLLENAIDDYRESSFTEINDSIEFLWLQNKAKVYKKKSKINYSCHIVKVNENNFILSGDVDGVIYSCKWDKELEQKKLNLGFWILSIAINPSGKYLAVLYNKSEERHICLYRTQDLKKISDQIIFDKKQDDEDSICRFYSDDILLIGGYRLIRILKMQNSKFEKMGIIDSFGKGSFAKDALNKVHSLSVDTVTRKIFFAHGTDLYIYNFNEKKIEKKVHISNKIINICEYDYSTNRVVVGTESGTLHFINELGEVIDFMTAHKSKISKIVCHPEYIFTSSISGEIYLWDRDGKLQKKIATEESQLQDFIIDGENIISVNQRTISLFAWNLPENPFKVKENISLKRKEKEKKYITLINDKFVTSHSYGEVFSYDLIKKVGEKIATNFFKYIYSFVNPNNNKLLFINYPLYDVYCDGKLLKDLLNTHNIYKDGQLLDLSISEYSFFAGDPNGGLYNNKDNVLYLYNKKGSVIVWDLVTEKILEEYRSSEIEQNTNTNSHVIEASLSSDNRYIVFVLFYSSGNKSNIYALDLERKKYQKITMEYCGKNIHIKLGQRNNSNIMVLSFEDQIQVWNFDKLLRGDRDYFHLENGNNYIHCIALAQNGERLISIDSEGYIVIWYIGNNVLWKDENLSGASRLLLKFKSNSSIEDCVYSPSLRKLITVGEEILIWNFN